GPVLVIARSANRWTVVVAVAVLLGAVVCRAGMLGGTVAVFVSTVAIAVCGGTRAPMLKLTLAPLASVPTVHVTTFGAVWLAPDGRPADAVPGGSVSGTVAPLEAEGRLLATGSG